MGFSMHAYVELNSGIKGKTCIAFCIYFNCDIAIVSNDGFDTMLDYSIFI